jgi:hypothetical protein
VPGLGAIELQRLNLAQLNAFYRVLLTTGRRNRPSGLAPKTVRYIHSIMHRALWDAVRWGYVVRNVAELLTRRRPRRRKCGCGVRRSFGPSRITFGAIGCMRRGCWLR